MKWYHALISGSMLNFSAGPFHVDVSEMSEHYHLFGSMRYSIDWIEQFKEWSE